MEQTPVQQNTNTVKPVPRVPNEQPLVNIDEFLRISDPESQTVYVEQRG